MRLGNGKTFTTKTENYSDKNMYIQSVELNGKKWNKTYIPYTEIENGGEIIFTMGDNPNTKWGTAPDSVPPALK
jgi:putative alpha-1,2-mannosidase